MYRKILVSIALMMLIAGGVQAEQLPFSIVSSVDVTVGNDGNLRPNANKNGYDLDIADIANKRRVTLVSFDVSSLTVGLRQVSNISLSSMGIYGGKVDVYGILEDVDNVTDAVTWGTAPGVIASPMGYPVVLDAEDITDLLLTIDVPSDRQRASSGANQALTDFVNTDTDGIVTLLLAPHKASPFAKVRSFQQKTCPTPTPKPEPKPDPTPPLPDPMSWEDDPHIKSISTIEMTATTATTTDDSDVEYYFACLTEGGNDSGWQSSSSYTDSGLAPDKTYEYQVKARNTGNLAETEYSEVGSATLLEKYVKPGGVTDVTLVSSKYAGGGMMLEGDVTFPTAAMIVNDVNMPNGFDLAQYDRLESFGYEVLVVVQGDVQDEVFTAADAETFDVLVVSESIGSSAANNLIGANVPMMHQESYGWSRHFFTTGLAKKWVNDPNGMIDVVSAHKIAAGFSGPVQFFTNPGASWTTDSVESLIAGAENVAQVLDGDGVANTLIFAIEAGTELADPNMLAANRIVGFSIPGNESFVAGDMTDEAWTMFDAAIAWLNCGPKAAMVVNPDDLSAGFDAAQKDRLESLGYEVTVVIQGDVQDEVFTAANAETFDVLVVSESIGSSAANNLIGVNAPMMHQESYGWSRHFFTLGLGRTWLNDPAGEINIVDDTHQIVMDAGLAAGQVAFFTDPSTAWTTDTVESLVAGAVNIAQIANADGVAHTIIFAIEAGTELADTSLAANRICGFSLPGNNTYAADVMTDDAWALYDAAIAWLDQ